MPTHGKRCPLKVLVGEELYSLSTLLIWVWRVLVPLFGDKCSSNELVICLKDAVGICSIGYLKAPRAVLFIADIDEVSRFECGAMRFRHQVVKVKHR